MKIALVSPNSIAELNGGGLYLRGLVKCLERVTAEAGDELLVVCREGPEQSETAPETRCRFLKKGRFLDVLGRVLGYPNYLGYYLRDIREETEGADVILLHNSRCGTLAARLDTGPDTKLIVIADNVEADLVRERSNRSGAFKKLWLSFEENLVRRAEASCLSRADAISFITAQDRDRFSDIYGTPESAHVLPVTMPHDSGAITQPVSSKAEKIVLFTGAFFFPPNIDAVRIFDETARLVQQALGPDIRFVAAGRNLANVSGLEHVVAISDPNQEEMAELFRNADLYLAPVTWGSGMKTKVAEALSFGCPVICLPNAAVGYEEAQSWNEDPASLITVNNSHEMAQAAIAWLSDGRLAQRASAARGIYDQVLSNDAAASRLRRIVYTSAAAVDLPHAIPA